MLKVVGTLFIEDRKLLLNKPRKNPTYQLIAGKVESGEDIVHAAIRECEEELGTTNLNHELFEFIMDFEEIASSDPNLKIHFHAFIYNGKLIDEPKTSDEISDFVWYDTSQKDIALTPTLQHKIIPYCLEHNLID